MLISIKEARKAHIERYDTHLSITESITNNPERFRSLFYNMPSIIDSYNTKGQDYAASYTHIGQIQQYYLSPDYNADADISIIADEAEKLYNTVVKDSINKIIIVDYPFCKSSSLPLLPASTEEQQKSYELESDSTT